MKSQITKLALLAVFLTFSAAETTYADGRDRLDNKSDAIRLHRVVDEDRVRDEDRINEDVRSEGREIADRSSEDRERLVATRHASNVKEANSRGEPRNRLRREQSDTRDDRSPDVERSSDRDEGERATVERRNDEKQTALLRGVRIRGYHLGRFDNRYLTIEGRCVISDKESDLRAIELDI